MKLSGVPGSTWAGVLGPRGPQDLRYRLPLLGAVVGIVVMLRGKGGRKTKVPFGPFMVVGTFLALFFGQSVVDWYAATL